MNLTTIIGTRPEAVKMAPVLRVLAALPGISSTLVSTGQHPDLVPEPLGFFGLSPDLDLRLMQAGEHPEALVDRAASALVPILSATRPDVVLVQGDTATALAGARAAARVGVKVGHVEAGLRSHDDLPWPEEVFRREIDGIAAWLFAPTPLAANNLRREGVGGAVHVTGNSGIDALHHVVARLVEDRGLAEACDAALPARTDRPLVLATLHRRESTGAGARELCAALTALAAAGAEIVMPLHPNGVMAGHRACLAGQPHIHLTPPLALPVFTRLMQRADVILTDSGGIQEEAPTLGKPVLVLRDVTERPEAVALGLATLVGLDRDRIVGTAQSMLAAPPSFAAINPYGDGRTARRIVSALLGEPFEPFAVGSPLPLQLAREARR